MDIKKEILFISYRFPPQNPGGVIRGVKFIKYLARFGWKVHVFVPQGSTKEGYEKDLTHPNIHIQEVYCPKPYEKMHIFLQSIRNCFSPTSQRTEYSAGSQTFKSPVLKRSIGVKLLLLLRFPDEAVFWRKHIWKAAKVFFKQHTACELIFCHGPPFSPFIWVLRMKKTFKKKTILDFRDTWSDDPDYIYPFPILKNLAIRLEKKALREASAIITVTETLKMNLVSKEPSIANKIYTLTNGYDPEDFIHIKDSSPPVRFRIMHAGNLFLRNTSLFLNGFKLFLEMNSSHKGEIDCIFWGSIDPATEQVIRQLRLEKFCKQQGLIPHAQIVEEYKTAGLFLMILQEGAVYNAAIPGKLFEYAAMRRPILALGPAGEAQQMHSENGWGTYLEGGPSAEKIAQAIEKYFLLWKTNQLIPFGSEENIKIFSREILTRQLENILIG